MINIKDILSLPPVQKGTTMIFAGIVILFVGTLALFVSGQAASWAIIALGAAVGMSGGIALSQSGK